jgi:hypothetical protein
MKAWSRKLLVANQFIMKESQNKAAANKSWFTVIVFLLAYQENQ